MAKNTRNFVKVEHFDGKPFWAPEASGESIEGVVANLREVHTRFGLQQVVDIGDAHSVGISAGLTALSGLEGEYVRLTFLGEATNPRTGRTYYDYLIEKAE